MSTAEPLDTDAPVAYCRTCGKPVMNATPQQIAQGTVFCELHSPAAAASAANPAGAVPPSPWATGTPPPMPVAASGVSPGLAFLLGWIPGVGAVYNGQYAKGLIHAVITGLLISIAGHSHGFEPLFGILIAAWFFYMPFEAYHTAKRRQLGQNVDEFSSLFPVGPMSARSPVGPLVLIGLGVVFLLNNLDVLNFDAIIKYWPVLFIALGVYLLYVRLRQPAVPPVIEVDNER